jgi:putative hydrolase of the HAD superfamily
VADRYIEISRTKTIVFEGTYPILDYLRNKYKLAIITNGFSEVVEHKMRNCRLNEYFEYVQTSEDAGVQKPDTKIFELVMQKFGVLPSQAIMIGDNLETDIAGGKNAGMRTILFDPKDKCSLYGDLKINNLMELTKYL